MILRQLYRSIWGTFKHRHKWARAKGGFKSCLRCGHVAQVKTRKPAAKAV